MIVIHIEKPYHPRMNHNFRSPDTRHEVRHIPRYWAVVHRNFLRDLFRFIPLLISNYL